MDNQNVLLIDDTIEDVKLAQAAGFRGIIFLPTQPTKLYQDILALSEATGSAKIV